MGDIFKMKGISARTMKNKNLEELNQELKKLKDELQSIRFSKVSGTAVSKLSKIKALRRNIARVLTLINISKRNTVISGLRKRGETEIKYLKSSRIPLDLRPKATRAIRRRVTKFQAQKLTSSQFKRTRNFPLRTFAVPL